MSRVATTSEDDGSRVTPLYDCIGEGYLNSRRADSRIAQKIGWALGDAKSVLNVGAGAGGYEPTSRNVIAVEPSLQMILQRPPTSAPVIVSTADAIPLADKCVDASMAIQTLHHWENLEVCLSELRRVTRKRIVIFMFDPTDAPPFWLWNDYLPILTPSNLVDVREAIAKEFPCLSAIPVSIPWDCSDGFLTAFWRRPMAYLDPNVRRNISAFVFAGEEAVAPGLEALARDIHSRLWEFNHQNLLKARSLYLGHRLLVAELPQ